MTTATSENAIALIEGERQQGIAARAGETYGTKYGSAHGAPCHHGQVRSKIPLGIREKALENAQRLWLLRRNREAMLSASGYSLSFGEPIWDMLLDLYISESIGRKISVSSLCLAAHVPQTTALRYLGEMLDAGLALRVDDPRDLRRSFVELSDDAFELLTKLFVQE
ncbi:hypothetical protein OOT33_11050 [Sphingobium sp. DEHP117]|uniref:hypothetical protein n=1 Tax=Sphingobium sp. DEHP117 TaxID=2993436 RepID=UPI0027D537BE|nr:hypothetical protein [Sphingobium sp. DEHP117]MDQ4420968.1 hypothetical protein [Sphingobium sp. DEHP117]